jgi:transcription antitermination factor NusG
MSSAEQLSWYAIHVAAKKEKQITSILSEKGYTCFLPLYTKRSTWSDRIKVTSFPLFPGYVFSQFDVQHRLPILLTPNVHGIVGAGKVPISIPDDDLGAIRTALENGLVLEPHQGLQKGDLVRVTKGPLLGVEGSFLRYHGSDRLVLSIGLINRSVSVEMDRHCVEPCSPTKSDSRHNTFSIY